MFIAALFTVAKIWKQAKCPSIDEWRKKMCIHNGILLSHKKNEILSFATTGMDLGGIMLSKISQKKTNSIRFHLYVESKKQK